MLHIGRGPTTIWLTSNAIKTMSKSQVNDKNHLLSNWVLFEIEPVSQKRRKNLWVNNGGGVCIPTKTKIPACPVNYGKRNT